MERARLADPPAGQREWRAMVLLGWFDAAQASAFGDELARFCDSELRLIATASPGKREDRRRKLLGKVLQRAREFAAAHPLNTYKKAKLGNRLKWTLKDLGHDDEFVDLLVKEILLALAG
jgi:hypothetical protein